MRDHSQLLRPAASLPMSLETPDFGILVVVPRRTDVGPVLLPGLLP